MTINNTFLYPNLYGYFGFRADEQIFRIQRTAYITPEQI